ncbi:MAG: hypothetical protein A2Y54_07005 [Chloroflexi bacterium RBG_16_51_16]|nr:MAG: hypothetical protein A2Y54_07005 [Chloroflexi bacterium RBG_16_51_16]
MNNTNRILQTIWGYFIRIILMEIGLSALVVVLLLLIEHSLRSFADWIFWSGIIFLAFVLLGFLGNLGITRGGLYQLGQSVSGESASDRVRSELKEETTSFSILPTALGVAILVMIMNGFLRGI